MQNFEQIPCPLCRAIDFEVVYPGNFPENLTEDFLKETYRASSDNKLFEQVVRCKKCNLVYLNPRLNAELVVGSYEEGEDAAHVEQDSMRVRTFTSAIKRIAKQYGLSLNKETKVLDIGCAGGAFLYAAKQLGLSTLGIEPNKWMSGYARKTYGLDVRSGILADHDLPENSFDLVTLWDVIEHVPDPAVELERIHKILKPGGLLVVNYPDFGSLAARMLKKKWPFLLSVHLMYYTRKTMRKQLKNAGYETLDMRMHWQTLEFGYVLKRIVPYFSFVRHLERFARKIRIHTIPMMYWMGQTQVVARKK